MSDGRFENVFLVGEGAVGPSAQLDTITLTDGTLHLAAGATYAAPDLTIDGGAIDGDATLITSGKLTAIFGELGGGGTIVVLPATATMDWTAALGIYASRFETAGTVTVTETGLGRPETSWGRRLVWENTGTVSLASGLFPVLAGDEGARFVNRGRVVKTGTGTFQFRPRLVNDGVLEIQNGTLTATRVEQSPDATLRFGISSASAFGRLSGTLRYQGRLEGQLLGGYVPAAGTSFPVIQGSALDGAFSSFSLPLFGRQRHEHRADVHGDRRPGRADRGRPLAGRPRCGLVASRGARRGRPARAARGRSDILTTCAGHGTGAAPRSLSRPPGPGSRARAAGAAGRRRPADTPLQVRGRGRAPVTHRDAHREVLGPMTTGGRAAHARPWWHDFDR